MTPSACLALPHVRPYPGTCWTVIVADTPKDARGHSRNYRNCITPLVEAGLVRFWYRETTGGCRERLYYRTHLKEPTP